MPQFQKVPAVLFRPGLDPFNRPTRKHATLVAFLAEDFRQFQPQTLEIENFATI